MITCLRRLHRAREGLTIIELLVSLAVFAMFVVMIDAMFFSATRTARTTELAADVQQNARIAVERLTRELRQTKASIDPYLCKDTLDRCIIIDTSQAGRHKIMFKSARLRDEPSVFCVYVREADDPLGMRGSAGDDWGCFDNFPGVADDVTIPPYSGPPYPGGGRPLCAPNTDTQRLEPCGTYTPIWQQYIGYYVDVSGQLRRVSDQLGRPHDTLDPTKWDGGDVVATYVDWFEICVNGSCPGVLATAANNITITLRARGTETVQGTDVPAQQVTLPGGSTPRD